MYSQKDPKWAKERLGSGPDTIGQSGCKLSSFCNLGKEMQWFDYTPQSLNKLMIKERLYTNGLLIADSILAKYFGLTTEKVKKDPGVLCIAETNYYANKGVPQHFFLYEKGDRVDPLDLEPNFEKNTYPIVSYRVFKKIVTTPPVVEVVPPKVEDIIPVPPKVEEPTPIEVEQKEPETKTVLQLILEFLINWFKK